MKEFPYEIHITVESGDLSLFKKTCEFIGVKPILLDLHNKKGEVIMKDLMTSSTHTGSDQSVLIQTKTLSDKLSQAGFKVIREKIETVPWHPMAPTYKNSRQVMPDNCYFECHLAVITNNSSLNKLRDLGKKHNCHISRNVFKKLNNVYFKIMLTYRSYSGTIENFESKISFIKESLSLKGFVVDKTIVEFALVDSKLNHDEKWFV